MTVQPTGGIPGFDPFSSRQDRDVRNALGAALITALQQEAADALDACAGQWQRVPLPAPCRAYLDTRLAAYRAVMADLRKTPPVSGESVAILLWNRHLFFECHEWLETLWHRARPPRKTALQGWIMAAGAFSQLQSSRISEARSLARKAAGRLSASGHCLAAIENLDDLIQGLAADPPMAVILDDARPHGEDGLLP